MKEKIAQLIERLEGDSLGPLYDAKTSFDLRREAAQVLREQQAEIERLEGDSSGPTYDDLTIFAASLDAAQALRVQQAEIERLDKCLEQQLEVNFKLAEIIEELKDQIETWECDNYNRQIGGE